MMTAITTWNQTLCNQWQMMAFRTSKKRYFQSMTVESFHSASPLALFISCSLYLSSGIGGGGKTLATKSTNSWTWSMRQLMQPQERDSKLKAEEKKKRNQKWKKVPHINFGLIKIQNPKLNQPWTLLHNKSLHSLSKTKNL